MQWGLCLGGYTLDFGLCAQLHKSLCKKPFWMAHFWIVRSKPWPLFIRNVAWNKQFIKSNLQIWDELRLYHLLKHLHILSPTDILIWFIYFSLKYLLKLFDLVSYTCINLGKKNMEKSTFSDSNCSHIVII